MTEKYIIFYSSKATKALEKIPLDISKRISEKVKILPENPFLGIKMHGRMDDLRKIKISNYRIVYKVIRHKLIIEIIEIESRGNMSYDR